MNNPKVILLTGATSGIGYGILKELLLQGHIVFGVGRNFQKIDNFKEEYKKKIIPIILDLSKIEEISKIFQKVEEHNLKFDSFINCAGFEETIPLKQYNNPKILEIFKVNIISTIEILRLFSLKKYSHDGSSVVLISSVMGNLGQPGKIGYCSSKAAINGLVKSAALELSRRKIRVNSVSPGIVNTELTKNLFFEVGQESMNRIIEKHPLGIGEVEDVVHAVLFLAIGKSQWISGIDLIVDGAYSAE